MIALFGAGRVFVFTFAEKPTLARGTCSESLILALAFGTGSGTISIGCDFFSSSFLLLALQSS